MKILSITHSDVINFTTKRWWHKIKQNRVCGVFISSISSYHRYKFPVSLYALTEFSNCVHTHTTEHPHSFLNVRYIYRGVLFQFGLVTYLPHTIAKRWKFNLASGTVDRIYHILPASDNTKHAIVPPKTFLL